MSPAAIQFALADARADILTLAKLLCDAAYPRRGSAEETQTICDFASKVQALIPHEEAVNFSSVESGEPTEETITLPQDDVAKLVTLAQELVRYIEETDKSATGSIYGIEYADKTICKVAAQLPISSANAKAQPRDP